MLQALARALPVKRDKIKLCWIWTRGVALERSEGVDYGFDGFEAVRLVFPH